MRIRFPLARLLSNAFNLVAFGASPRGSAMRALGVAAGLALSCDGAAVTKHDVYFVGYVYDGATGKRLAAAELTSIDLKYRDRTIGTKIDGTDGRFVTTEPLPTWQDFSVYVVAAGYRPFVSTNPGIDVPKSLQATNGASETSTTQTFDVAIRLFPAALKAPKVNITIEKADALVTSPAPARAAGTLRLTPTSSSVVEQNLAGANRVWSNDEDLLTQTVTKAFTGGTAEIGEGELVYGVTYQLAIFGVDGYQPYTSATVSTSTSATSLSAGAVTSLLVTLQPDLKAPLRILGTNADACRPPAPTSNAYGAAIDLTFSEEVEPAGPTFAEDVDNGLSFTVTASAGAPACTLSPSLDPTKQEHGTRATINGRVLTLAFNPALGLTTMVSGLACVPPAGFASVVYGLSNVVVQPKGDPVRKASLGALLAQSGISGVSSGSSALACPPRSTSF